ncbi:hypothetical protein BSL78_02713 [Apostichopus japonicus]|uniref:Uncharacterized protein n=1 Tax=Stichopus japonicus TaxID=307972 RepID=A0A2G8LJC0_STIJA|nr:hypothetical protein BSL78_02713 [Apostichopus japonicus]
MWSQCLDSFNMVLVDNLPLAVWCRKNITILPEFSPKILVGGAAAPPAPPPPTPMLEMDNKKTEAGECTEENGNSSVEREESSIRSNSLTLSVSGDKNIVLSNCKFIFPEIKRPKRRAAPLRKEDEATPRKKKRAGSDKPLSDKGRNMSDETLPGTSGSAGKSGRGKKSAERKKSSDTDKENKPQVQCSTMPMVFKNVKKSRRIRVNTFDVEVESIDQNHTKKWLPGRFRPVDFSGWGHLTLLNKETGKEEPI